MLDHDAVLRAVSPVEATDRVRDAFVSFARGEWQMPPKVYLASPPGGDFRAMPARGEGLAMLKWITSFPGNPRHGLPTVTGVVLVSDASNGEPVAMLDARAVTALRTGAAAAVATQEVAREDASTVGLVGCGLHGMWVGRCMADAEYGPGVCFDPDPEAAGAAAADLGWEVGDLGEALACDVVCTVTPGHEPVVRAGGAAARPAPEPARRRRPGKGRGRGGGDRPCPRRGPPVLRRVAPGKQRRRADRRRRGGRGRPRRRRRGGSRLRRPGRRAAAPTRRSRCSTRPAWPSRTWRSCSGALEARAGREWSSRRRSRFSLAPALRATAA